MIDLLVIFAYFVAILTIGLRFKGKDHSLKEFALANRSIPWWAVLVSVLAAETSAGTFFGLPAEGYHAQNLNYLQLTLGAILGRVLVSVWLLPAYFRLEVCSVYELLEKRYSPFAKRFASGVFLITRSLASGTRIYIAAILITVLLKLKLGTQPSPGLELLFYSGTIFLIATLTTLYTVKGGIEAVIWTDLLQTTLMVGGAIFVLIYLVTHTPSTATSAFSFQVFEFDIHKPYSFWAGVFGMGSLTLATHGTDQDMVQRLLTAKSSKEATWSAIGSGLAEIPIALLFLSIGLALKAFYIASPNASLPQTTNEIFPFFILSELPPGMKGLLIAAVLATAMGSLSTALNALATSTVRDWIPSKSGAEEVSLARKWTIRYAVILSLIGIATSVFVLWNPGSRILPIALGIFGFTYGPLLGVFLFAVLSSRKLNDSQLLIGFFLGVAVVLFLTFGFDLPFVWRVLAGAIGTLLSFFVLSKKN